jgi:hypothetical protein
VYCYVVGCPTAAYCRDGAVTRLDGENNVKSDASTPVTASENVIRKVTEVALVSAVAGECRLMLTTAGETFWT